MKEFMLQWQEGQEYLITAKKLRFRYEHGIMNGKHRKTVDRVLTVRQFEIIRQNPDNGYYSFFYNGERQVNISIDTASDPNLVMIKCRDRFPGYAPGHTVYQSLPYDAKAKPIERFFVKLDNGKAFERREFGTSNKATEDQGDSKPYELSESDKAIIAARRRWTKNFMESDPKPSK